METWEDVAIINSLGGKMDNITVICAYPSREERYRNVYIVKYGDVYCTALFNCFNFCFYADDKYGIIEEERLQTLLTEAEAQRRRR